MTDPQKGSLRLLDKYLKETPKEEIDKVISEINAMEFEGITAKEYFELTFKMLDDDDSTKKR